MKLTKFDMTSSASLAANFIWLETRESYTLSVLTLDLCVLHKDVTCHSTNLKIPFHFLNYFQFKESILCVDSFYSSKMRWI